ncbi:sugar ABC transporter permease [Catenulispora sp. NF23]|uniref:Sugar ABC transporter permease n=1 Tax=Catenulispora pinistramenti TaxID=2705254 RepID=A0ABS5KJ07_9ACTN|nr:sugar ABC transporter permease [Catenulispora pinistramenti]MBS2532223.1 sugar ABC transporter permease [Catenulispora pinistramenti]MBS2546376.1 sugar ABC transporter permease [Catenulispora pinistramenti]
MARSVGGVRGERDRIYVPYLLPALLIYTFLFIAPAAVTIWYSFTKWQGLGTTAHYNGLANYRAMLSNSVFLTAFRNTLILVVVGGAFVFALTFLTMVVMREMRGRSFVRSMLFVPCILSPIAIGTAVGFLLNPDGALNQVLSDVGLHSLTRGWLGPDLIFKCIIAAVVWISTGFYVAIMMSRVDAIPEDLYETARLAGANRLEQFRYITFPLTRDALSTGAVLWVIGAVKTFEIVIAFTGTAGNPPIQARSAAVEQYLAVTGGVSGTPELGSAAAIGVVMFLLTAVLVVALRRLLRSEAVEL